MRAPPITLAAVLTLAACQEPAPAPPPVSCGAGTQLIEDRCELLEAPVTCTPGTILNGLRCEAPDPCADGTVPQGPVCVPFPVPVTCGVGTTLQGSACNAPASFDCGPGTVLEGVQCVPAPSRHGGFYDVRVPVSHVPADGRTKLPVLSLGALPSGAPSTEPVVLAVIPPSAGGVSPASFELGRQGSTSYFTPQADAGTFRITLSAASAPLVPLATSPDITLEPPVGVGSVAACLRSDNVLFVDADPHYWSSAPQEQNVSLLIEADWASRSTWGPSDVMLTVTPWEHHVRYLRDMWTLSFSAAEFGVAVAPGMYPDAGGAEAFIGGRPRIYIHRSSEGCQTTFGAFEVHRIAWTGSTLDELLISFEQHCPALGNWEGRYALHGCLHYRRQR